MAKKQAQRPIIGRCVEITGSPVAGIVLYRLIFWKPTRKHGGRLWIAKTHAELAFETGLTPKQVKTGLARLRELGLIQTSQHLFQGRNVGHVLVTGKCAEQLQGASGVVPDGTTQEGPDGTGQGGPQGTAQAGPQGTASYTSYMQGESQGESQGYCGQSPARGTKVSGKDSGEMAKIPRSTSVKDVILAHSSPAKIGTRLHKPDSFKALELAWKSTVSEEYDKFVPPLTQKQVGQLKLFRGKCPAGRAEQVMKHAVRHWIEFVKQVETEVGIKATPAEPNLDFLLKHAGVAVNLAASPKHPPEVTQEASVVIPAVQSVQLISESVDDEAPQTLEDLLAIIGPGKAAS